MRLTTQLHVLDVAEGWKAIYSPFKHGIAFLRREDWTYLVDGSLDLVQKPIVRYLLDRQILVEDGFERKWLEEKVAIPTMGFTSMFLIITRDCNFACPYCIVRENVDAPVSCEESMDPDVAIAAVDLFERCLRSRPPTMRPRVTFYGGEPMLNQAVMFAATPRISRINYPDQERPVEIAVITNGYIFNPRLAELFKAHDVQVCFSIDGKKRHHDITRWTKAGRKPTFDTVIANYRKYQAMGLSMSISTAMGRHNVFDLPEIATFYVQDLAPTFVELQIPYQVGGERNPYWVSTREISGLLMEAHETLRSHGVTEATVFRYLYHLANGAVHFRGCGSSGTQIAVAPDGMLGPCHSTTSRTFFAGNVADPECDPMQMSNFQEWARRFPLNMEGCHECAFIAICGGGCTHGGYVATRSIWGKDPQICSYMKEIVEWWLRDHWKRTGMTQK